MLKGVSRSPTKGHLGGSASKNLTLGSSSGHDLGVVRLCTQQGGRLRSSSVPLPLPPLTCVLFKKRSPAVTVNFYFFKVLPFNYISSKPPVSDVTSFSVDYPFIIMKRRSPSPVCFLALWSA